MPRRLTKKLFALIFIGVSLFILKPVMAQSEGDKMQDLARQIEEYNAQIKRLQGQAASLSNEVASFDAKIRVTELKIDSTQSQIGLLGGRIDQLVVSLDSLERAFGSRVNETYKLSRLENSPVLFLASDNVSEAVAKYHYLQKIQAADKKLIGRLDSAKTTYSEQKVELEDLEKVLGVQKEQLDVQKSAKANILAITRNDEKKYQELLAHARAEYEAIQAIVSGQGDESEVGRVASGERIASIIQGPSCNSNGEHLHFIVSNGSTTENPFSYLKPGVDFVNCSGSGECSAGDPFNPSGSWEWPISPQIRLTQGYGSTWAVQNTWVGRVYNFHNGIDINNENSPEVKAVQAGTLFRGSFSGSNGCRLRYVRVKHEGSSISTYYLHINY